MEPLPKLATPKYVNARERYRFYISSRSSVLHLVQKHREECIDQLSDEQQKKIPRSLKKSMAILPLGSPSVPCVTLNPTVLKNSNGKLLGHRAKQSTNEDLFNYCFPRRVSKTRKSWTFANHIKTDGFSTSVLFSRPNSESGTANVRKVIHQSGTWITVEGVCLNSVNRPVTPKVCQRVVSIDPGRRDMVVALAMTWTDKHAESGVKFGEEAAEVIKMSTKQTCPSRSEATRSGVLADT